MVSFFWENKHVWALFLGGKSLLDTAGSILVAQSTKFVANNANIGLINPPPPEGQNSTL